MKKTSALLFLGTFLIAVKPAYSVEYIDPKDLDIIFDTPQEFSNQIEEKKQPTTQELLEKAKEELRAKAAQEDEQQELAPTPELPILKNKEKSASVVGEYEDTIKAPTPIIEEPVSASVVGEYEDTIKAPTPIIEEEYTPTVEQDTSFSTTLEAKEKNDLKSTLDSSKKAVKQNKKLPIVRRKQPYVIKNDETKEKETEFSPYYAKALRENKRERAMMYNAYIDEQNIEENKAQTKEWYQKHIFENSGMLSPEEIAKAEKIESYKATLTECDKNFKENISLSKDILYMDNIHNSMSEIDQHFETINDCYSQTGDLIINDFYNNDNEIADEFEEKKMNTIIDSHNYFINPQYCKENCSLKSIIDEQTARFDTLKNYLFQLLDNQQ